MYVKFVSHRNPILNCILNQRDVAKFRQSRKSIITLIFVFHTKLKSRFSVCISMSIADEVNINRDAAQVQNERLRVCLK